MWLLQVFGMKFRMKIAVVMIAVIAVLAASFFTGALVTHYGFEERYEGVPKPTVMSEPGLVMKEAGPAPVQERMVIYNGYVSLETGDIGGYWIGSGLWLIDTADTWLGHHGQPPATRLQHR